MAQMENELTNIQSNQVLVAQIYQPEDLQKAWDIRKKVFVEEQNCPEEIEWEFEEDSTHYLASYNKFAVGTARWRPTALGIKLERFAVLKHCRNLGVGTRLLQTILTDVIPKHQVIYLHAQMQAKPFYEKHNFTPVGQNFWEAGIEHVKMFYQPF